ncbi:alpha/beta fold hydrolase [Streptomyces europaeiscabiei]|uniref:alpha/beta fold hydrolase n=1 Tax=Streptomyces europaeiscabiei TaxID=146819 RepID=UPI0038F755B8
MNQRFVQVGPAVRLWSEVRGDPRDSTLLLIMGAGASGLGWPEGLVDALAVRHHVIRYDHRDTGRSSLSFDTHPYRIVDLASDAIAVLDAYEVERAHIVGHSLGGMLTQLLIADHPERLLSATVMGTGALSSTPLSHPDGSRTPVGRLPPIDARVLELWSQPHEDRGLEGELDHRVEHWRVLNGDQIPFDSEEFRASERRIIEHAGRYEAPMTHGRADHSGMDRTEELGRTEVPTLVISAPAEPVFPPPHPDHLAQVIAGARLAEIPGMGHALPRAVHAPLAAAVLDHTLATDARPRPEAGT